MKFVLELLYSKDLLHGSNVLDFHTSDMYSLVLLLFVPLCWSRCCIRPILCSIVILPFELGCALACFPQLVLRYNMADAEGKEEVLDVDVVLAKLLKAREREQKMML